MENQDTNPRTVASNNSLLSEWDYKKNTLLDPNTLLLGSNKRVWWICPKGHEYSQTVDKRNSRGSGCPYCAGKKVLEGYNDLQALSPIIASEWDYDKNGDLLPTQVTLHSNKKVWWKCSKCGNEWYTQINGRANGTGCPVCSIEKRIRKFRESTYLQRGINDLLTLRPDLAEEWDKERNGDKKPSDFTCGSKEMIYWKCAVCGNEWSAQISNRAQNNSGCPKCMKYSRTSFPEQALLYYIRKVFPSAQNGYTEIFSPRKMELDIFIPELQLGIEYDGQAWHSGETAVKSAGEKYLVCQKKGIRLLRIVEAKESEKSNCDAVICRKEQSDKGLDSVIQQTIQLILNSTDIQAEININTSRDRGEILRQYITIIKEKSISACYPDVANHWDYTKNNGITPEMVNANSPRKYWWLCEKGHSYHASASNVCINRTGCPICSGHQLLSGYNDLATRYPEVGAEWDNEKNYPLSAADVMPGSQKKYWWICPVGHSYQTTPNARTASKAGCPYCSGHKVLPGFNDLASQAPEVSQKWDHEKNAPITPQDVAAGSDKSVWWKCENGHSWRKKIISQVKNNSCPVCSGRQLVTGVNDLSVTHPKLAEEWHPTLNEPLSPKMVTKNDTRKVWWKCHTCGHEWQSSIYVRVQSGCGCPKCGYKRKMQETRRETIHKRKKDLASMFPEIAKEWDYQSNDGLTPSDVSFGSNRKVWWICPRGHHYQAWLTDRTGKWKTGCPYCAGKRKLQQD